MVQIGSRSLQRGKARCSGSTGIVIVLATSFLAVLAFYGNTYIREDSSPSSLALLEQKNSNTKSKNQIRKPQSVSGKRKGQMQIVFSTSCSYSHDWQSYLFFFHAMMHEQPGNVTRIVSGCSEEQEAEMKILHQEQIAIMSDRFRIHFTPEFGKVEGRNWQTTKYWNKPFGVKHWLENVFGYRFEGDISTPYDDDIVVLVDPDMLLQRPFTNDYSGAGRAFWHPHIQNNDDLYDKVDHGKPIAQTYSFNDAWVRAVKGHMVDVVGEGSPALDVSPEDAKVAFSAGPPYMLTARDMFRLSYHWAKFLPFINEYFDGMMAEMYGYCTAAAHLNLRHQIAKGFMVSNIAMSQGEGWEFLDDVTDNVCDVENYGEEVPYVIHFCQRYSIGEFFLSKYKVPPGILSCDHKMFELPPKGIAAYTNYSHYGDGSIVTYTEDKKRSMYRQGYMVCSLMDGFNKAAKFFKDHNCPSGANYDATWNHFREEKLQGCTTVHNCPV